MTTFTTVLVSRLPNTNGPPQLVEVDRLVTSSISWVDELNRPGSATLACKVGTLSHAVKERLADLRSFPCEVRVYADTAVAWAGSLDSLQIQGQTVSLNCVGLLGYLARWGVVEDVTFTQTDQLTIARSLVNAWQAKTYGNFGIDTTSPTLSGVLRDRTYLRKDQKNVLAVVTELGAVIDGYDLHVDPGTRKLVLSYPQRGQDLTDTVVLDARSIASANVVQAVTADDVVSDASAIGSGQNTAGEQVDVYTYRQNTALQQAFGRTWEGQSFSDITELTTLNAKADGFLGVRGQQMLQPGVTLRPNVGTGVQIGAIEAGDTVAYAYDAGLGMQAGNYRVAKVSVQIDESGQQALGVEFV